jgi:small subunit ribosomal protein S5
MNVLNNNKAVDDKLYHVVASVRRNDKVVEGGRKSSYSVVVISGDKKGRVTFSFAKHKEVLAAKQKAIGASKKTLFRVNLKESRTIYHDISYSHGATTVFLRSAPLGTGIVAGGAMKTVFEVLGIKDIVAKCVGSSCIHNLVLTTMRALKLIRTPKTIALMRGKNVDDLLKNSKVFSGKKSVKKKNKEI